MMKIAFDEKATKRLLQSIWGSSERSRTRWDAYYNDLEDADEIAAFLADPDNEKDGLPCLLVHGTPFGIFLSGNCPLQEHEEIFAHQANPNTHPDPERLASETAAFFKGSENPLVLHLTEDPWLHKGVVFELYEGEIGAEFLMDYAAVEQLKESLSANGAEEEADDDDDEADESDWWRGADA